MTIADAQSLLGRSRIGNQFMGSKFVRWNRKIIFRNDRDDEKLILPISEPSPSISAKLRMNEHSILAYQLS